MKLDFNKRYMSIALHALLVILCGILAFAVFTHFGKVWTKIVDFVSVFMPIFYGMAIAYLIYPIVKFFETKIFCVLNKKKRYGLARILSVFVVFSGVIGLIVAFCMWILPHIVECYVDLQERSNMYLLSLQEWLFEGAASMGEFSEYVTQLVEYVIDLMENLYEYSINQIPDISSLVPILIDFVTNFFLGIVLSIYFLFAKEKLHAQIKKFLRACLNEKKFHFVSQSARLAHENFGGYIKGQLVDALAMGGLSYFILMLPKIPYFPLLSVIVAISSLIPIIGWLIGIVIGSLIIFLVNPIDVIWFVLFTIILYVVVIYFLRPHTIRVGVEASVLFMFTAIVIMTGLIGFWGLVIGVPVFVVLYTILHSAVDKRLQQKGLSIDQADYYGTDAGKQLYRERENKRMRRVRTVKKEEIFDVTEEFIAAKDEPIAPETSDPSDDTGEFVLVKKEEITSEPLDSSEEDNTTEEIISQ